MKSNCVPIGTEIFTIDGWKNVENISNSEMIASINPTTLQVDYQQITNLKFWHYQDEIYHLKNARTYDMTLGPNHKVLMWDRYQEPQFVDAELVDTLAEVGDSALSHSCLKRSGIWTGDTPSTFEIAGKNVNAKDWAAFMGIYLSEGHAQGTKGGKSGNKVGVTQNLGQKADQIEMLLNKLPWKFNKEIVVPNSNYRFGHVHFIASNNELHKELFQYGNSATKYVPNYLKKCHPDILQEFLYWMNLGDGRKVKGWKGKIVLDIAVVSKRLSYDCAEIMTKLGYGGTVTAMWMTDKDTPSPDFRTTGRMILRKNKQQLYSAYGHTTKGIFLDCRFMKRNIIQYDGQVCSFEVPNRTWLMRQNNKTCWTGSA